MDMTDAAIPSFLWVLGRNRRGQEGTRGDKRGQEGKGEGGEIWSEQSGVLREGRKKYCAGKRIFLHGAGASCTMGIGCKSSKKSKE